MWEFKARNVVKICITLDFHDEIIAYSAATVNIFCKRKISLRMLPQRMIPRMRNPELFLGIVQTISRSQKDWAILVAVAFQLDQKETDFFK